jgi:hypothetical protein
MRRTSGFLLAIGHERQLTPSGVDRVQLRQAVSWHGWQAPVPPRYERPVPGTSAG